MAGGSKLGLAAAKAHSFVCKSLSFSVFSLRENDGFPQRKQWFPSEKTM